MGIRKGIEMEKAIGGSLLYKGCLFKFREGSFKPEGVEKNNESFCKAQGISLGEVYVVDEVLPSENDSFVFFSVGERREVCGMSRLMEVWRCSACGRITSEISWEISDGSMVYCPDCWFEKNRETMKVSITSTYTKADESWSKLGKWIEKELEFATGQQEGDVAWTFRKVLKKMSKLEKEW